MVALGPPRIWDGVGHVDFMLMSFLFLLAVSGGIWTIYFYLNE